MQDGFRVADASGWRDAVQLLQSLMRETAGCPSVAVLDVRMSEMNGFALAAKLRCMYPDLKVVFITGEPCVEDEITAVTRGYYDYLSKTAALSQLTSRVRRAMTGEPPVRPAVRPDDLRTLARQYVSEGQFELACQAFAKLAVDLEFDQHLELAAQAYTSAAACADSYSGVDCELARDLRKRAEQARLAAAAE